MTEELLAVESEVGHGFRKRVNLLPMKSAEYEKRELCNVII